MPRPVRGSTSSASAGYDERVRGHVTGMGGDERVGVNIANNFGGSAEQHVPKKNTLLCARVRARARARSLG